MKKLGIVLYSAALLLLPSSVLAAAADDGAQLGGADVNRGSFTSASFIFCNAHVEADADTCAEFDLNQTGSGMPDFILMSRDANTTCSGDVTITINGQTTTGGTEHTLATLNDANTSAWIEAPVHRFIDADVATDTACTDMTVNMTLFFRRR